MQPRHKPCVPQPSLGGGSPGAWGGALATAANVSHRKSEPDGFAAVPVERRRCLVTMLLVRLEVYRLTAEVQTFPNRTVSPRKVPVSLQLTN